MNTQTTKWVVHSKGGPNQKHWEICIVKEDNEHGITSQMPDYYLDMPINIKGVDSSHGLLITQINDEVIICNTKIKNENQKEQHDGNCSI